MFVVTNNTDRLDAVDEIVDSEFVRLLMKNLLLSADKLHQLVIQKYPACRQYLNPVVMRMYCNRHAIEMGGKRLRTMQNLELDQLVRRVINDVCRSRYTYLLHGMVM